MAIFQSYLFEWRSVEVGKEVKLDIGKGLED